jgi:Na+-translocating ferredoxin:NAD+ oxidoreductase RnfE subunit
MKSKEEAKELVDKYKYRIIRGVEIEQMSISLAKQCALICVDEIIESIRHIIGEKLRVEYYLEVKQEIEKL